MEELLTLTPEEETPQDLLTISPAPNAAFMPVEPGEASAQAAKANFGLGARSPGVDNLKAAILNGTEYALRNQIAVEEDQILDETRFQKMAQIASFDSLTPQNISDIQSLATAKRTNPDTIFEKLYSDQLTNFAITNRGTANEVAADAYFFEPEATQQITNRAKNTLTRIEGFKRLASEIDARVKGESWYSWGTSLVGQSIPFLSWYRTNNLLDGAPTESFLPGSNKAEQVRFAWLVPVDEGMAIARAALDDLYQKNPLEAQTFAHALVQYGANERLMNNLFGLSDIDFALGVGKAVLGAKAIQRLGRRFAKGEAGEDVSVINWNDIKTPRAENLQPGAPRQEPPSGRLGWIGDGEYGRGKATAGQPDFPTIDQYERAWETYRRNRFDRQVSRMFGGPDDNLPPLVSYRKFMNDYLKAAVKADTTAQTLEGMGEIAKAAEQNATRIFANRIGEADPFNQGLSLRLDTPSLANPFRIFDDPSSLSREQSLRLAQDLEARAAQGASALLDPARVARLTEEAENVGIDAAKARLQADYHHISDAIIDFTTNPVSNIDNIRTVSVRIGKLDGSLFSNPFQARNTALDIYGLTTEFRIKQQGSGFYIDIPRPIREDEDAVRKALITTSNTTPQAATGMFMSMLRMGVDKLRSAEDLLSDFQRANRHVATHAPQEVKRLVVDWAKDIGGLTTKQHDRLTTVLEHNRDFVKGLDRGQFWRSQAELDQAYMRLNRVMPTLEESRAYWAYVQLNDLDWWFRNMGWYRDKARLGYQDVRFALPDSTGETVAVKTPWFSGRPVDDLPAFTKSGPDFSVYLRSSADKEGRLIWKHDATDTDLQEIARRMANGNKAYQVYNPLDHPLQGIGVKGKVHFVLTDTAETKLLSWRQAEYNPGGHIVYPHNWFVKQARIGYGPGGRLFHYGDASIFNFSSEAQAKKFGSAMEEGRLLLGRGDDAMLQEHLNRTLPYSVDEFKALFSEKGHLDKDSPIAHTFTGRDVFETNTDLIEKYPGLRDHLNDPFNDAATLDRKFLAERGPTLPSIREAGSEANPVYRLTPSKLMDPTMSLQRGLANSIRGRFMNDYKISAAESFVKEFSAALKQPPEVLARNPLYHLYNPTWNDNIVDKGFLATAKNAQMAVKNFLGTQSELGAHVGWIEQKVMNSIYGVGGDTVADWASDRILGRIIDPPRFMRATAFHASLGFFNPVQLFVQLQTLTNVYALSPLQAVAGTAGGVMMRRLALTESPDILNAMASKAGAFGWTKEQFLESYELLRSSGIYNVAGETAMRNDVFDPKLFMSGYHRFLDKGTMFFAEGERLVRLTAWNSAYLEFRKTNPTKAVGQREMAAIMTRADDLSVNMTRASNARWQEGWSSVPTQFLAFPARLMEQFLGKRLSKAEKLRAFVAYSTMYGVPMGLSGALGIPFYEDIKQAAFERNINLSNPVLNALVEGLPSMALKGLLGEEFNYAQRYGPGGLTIFKEVLEGEKTPIELLVGPGGKTLYDIGASTMPFFRYFGSLLSGDPTTFPLLGEDFIDASRTLSVANNAAKIAYGLQTGRYFSKNETYLTDVTPFQTIFMGVTGMQKMELTDAFIRNNSLGDLKKDRQRETKEILKELRRGFAEGYHGRYNKMHDHMTRAEAIMESRGWTYEERSSAMTRAMSGYESYIDKINRDWIEKAPLPDKLNRMNNFGQ